MNGKTDFWLVTDDFPLFLAPKIKALLAQTLPFLAAT
jgi:hypothetical protein